LLAAGFNRQIFLRALAEEAGVPHIWQLQKPAYGLVGSGSFWFLAAFKALEAHELQSCPFETTLFKLNDSYLFVTTQVENLIFSRTNTAMDGFAEYMGS
jgi:hypothetical protein